MCEYIISKSRKMYSVSAEYLVIKITIEIG